MQMRRLNEANIGFLALGKVAELGRQLNLATNQKAAEQMAKKLGVKTEAVQEWANGYVAFDVVIALTGVLGMIQGMRKNRKGAGQAALVQGGTTLGYSLYYLLYSLFGLKGSKFTTKVVNLVAAFGHAYSGLQIIRFAQKAVK